jgi:formate hydrogenlyase transcriptional activator
MGREIALMADLEKHYQSLLRLCRVIQGHRDLRTLFQEAAKELHELTNCGCVSLVLSSTGPAPHHSFLMEFAELPNFVEAPSESPRTAAVQWVVEHRQPRVVRRQDGIDHVAEPPGGSAQCSETWLYLPLVCRSEALGVLGLACQLEEQVERWDQDLLERLSSLLALALDNLAAHARMAELERFQREMVYLRDEVKMDRDLRLLTGESQPMKAVRLAIQQVARLESTVLILGETGTGKELVARAIHQLSPRRDHLLVTVNCAALAPGIIASELFGHEQGAFTGATKRRPGRFELAHQGTIFLDEIGELPPETQVMLLRVLQERVIERVGGQVPIAMDVRIIAATHQDLTAAMSQGRFRSDLFFRLNVFPIRVPPLRERREDIPDLVRHFLHHFGRRMSKPVAAVSPGTLKLLMEYHWPGNVRELENLIERAMIVASSDTLEVDPNWLNPSGRDRAVAAAGSSLAELERRTIVDALARCQGKIYGPNGAAVALGLKPTTLYGKMRKHQIEKRTAST